MENKIIQFEVSSLEELRVALALGKVNGARFAAVRVFGPKVFTRHFDQAKVPMPELIASLKNDAAQALSISPAEVEVAVELLSSEGDSLRGVLTAIPQVLLEEFIDILDENKILPVSVVSLASAVAEEHLKGSSVIYKDCCLVNFLKPHGVSVVMFLGGEPVFFREMFDTADNEIVARITDTIRYCCGRSVSKQIEEIVFTGNVAGKEDVIKRIQASAAPLKVAEKTAADGPAIRLTAPNLLGKYAFDLKERAAFSRCLTWGLVLAVGVALLGAVALVNVYQQVARAQAAEKLYAQ
ncbi:MAG: hypothetical protein WCO69_04470 [Candidatus Omnitrophota bacterium]